MPDVTQRTGFPPSLHPLPTPSPFDIPPEIIHLEETQRSLPIVHMLLPHATEGESKFVLTPPTSFLFKARIIRAQDTFNCFYQLRKKYREKKFERKYGRDK